MSNNANHTVSEFPRLTNNEPPESCLKAPPCAAAEIGKLFAMSDALSEEYGDKEFVGTGLEGAINQSVFNHACEAAEAYVNTLSHVRARSADGAAVQAAAAIHVVRDLVRESAMALNSLESGGLSEDTLTEKRWEMERRGRAVERLLYSVISVLMDRVEADFEEYGVEALAGEYNNPWLPGPSRLRSVNELRELRSTQPSKG